MLNEKHINHTESDPEHYFTIVLEGIRSDFRAVSDEVFSLKKELRDSVHRLEGEMVKIHQKVDAGFTQLNTRMDNFENRMSSLEHNSREHTRQIGGIMEMVAQNTEDIYTLKEDVAEIKQRPRFA